MRVVPAVDEVEDRLYRQDDIDLTGRSRGGVPAPHAQDYKRNYGPNGKSSINRDGKVHAADPDDIKAVQGAPQGSSPIPSSGTGGNGSSSSGP